MDLIRPYKDSLIGAYLVRSKSIGSVRACIELNGAERAQCALVANKIAGGNAGRAIP